MKSRDACEISASALNFACSPSCSACDDLIFASRCASASPIVASRLTSAVRRLPSALRYSSSSLISWIVSTSTPSPIFSRSVRRLARQLLREALTIAVHLLDGQRAEDRSQVPFERLEDDLLHLVVRHAEKPLGRRLQRRVVAADLDVRDRLDRDRARPSTCTPA